MTPTIRLIIIAILMTIIVIGADLLWGLSSIAKLITIICIPLISVGWEVTKTYLENRKDDGGSDDSFVELSKLSQSFNELENRLIRCETILSLLQTDDLTRVLSKLEKRIESLEISTEMDEIETILDEKRLTKEAQKLPEY
jgi:hypothetical protein